jgi:penicillin-binding protein 1B
MLAPRRYWLKIFLVASVIGLFVLAYLDALVLEKFSGSKWQVATQAYARPLELFEGKGLSADQLQFELDSLSYVEVKRPISPGQFSRIGSQFDIYVRGFEFFDGYSPSRLIRLRIASQRIVDLQSGGAQIATQRLDPLMIGSFQSGLYEDRHIISLDKVPPALIQILLATEDRNFMHHHGISLRGIARAMMANIRAGGFAQGGSTLTQQLVKNFFLTQERSLLRKLLEIPMALLMELHFSKEEILEAYINEVFLGQDGARAIHGFELASQFYFGVSLQQTSIAQQALLVGMVKGASFYNPRRHPQRALDRRNLILDSMVDNGFLAADKADRAKNESLLLAGAQSPSSQKFPAFMDYLRRQLRYSDMHAALASGSNVRVFTTMDPYIQRRAELSMTKELARLERWRGIDKEQLEGALVAVHPATGAVVAMVGGRQVKYQGFNRALDAKRPVGSLLKPAAYLTALESGKYHLASILSDAPIAVPLDNKRNWEPKNYDKLNHGDITLVEALRRSYNQALVRMSMDVGLDSVVDTIGRLGISDAIGNNPSLLLGAVSLAPVDMAAMYSNIASLGRIQKLRAIDAIKVANDDATFFSSSAKPAIDPAALSLLQFGLAEVVRAGTAVQLNNVLPAGLTAAGKTGTSDDGRDSWFAGFTGDIAAVVWIGRDDNAEVGLSGSAGAMHVWGDFVAQVSYKPLQIKPMPGIDTLWVDGEGRLSDAGCPGAVQMPFGVARPEIDATCKLRQRDPWKWLKDIF